MYNHLRIAGIRLSRPLPASERFRFLETLGLIEPFPSPPELFLSRFTLLARDRMPLPALIADPLVSVILIILACDAKEAPLPLPED